jgi:alkanesulfonate monooxygenase SsuD/methylene tetrahydromethanopterin reductase-like flavin-dependent oxidoreductase (luciferase family)
VSFQNPAQWRIPWPDLYAETLDFIRAAEALGIDEVWLSEHHFADDGTCPALLPVAAAIAASTSRIRIGTKVMLLPFHHPVRLAEDAAVVDILSNGRLDLGLAAGYRPAEFAGFGIPRSERAARMDEGLSILKNALSGETFEHHGRFYDLGPLTIVPAPLQRPIPLWLGGRSAAALRRAAENGCHLQLADFILEHAIRDYHQYQDALRTVGADPTRYAVAAVATAFLDEDRERAWHIAGEHLLYQQNLYQQWFTEGSDRPSDRYQPMQKISELKRGSYLIGDPDDVLQQLRDYHRQVPFTHISIWMLLPGMRLGPALRSLELFCRRVLPALG